MQLSTWLMDKHGPFMDTSEVATVLRIQQRSLYQRIYKGTFHVPHVRHGKKILFPTTAVAEYIEDAVQQATA